LPQRACLARCVDETPSLEQLAGETGAEETGAAGDHDAHRGLHVIRAIDAAHPWREAKAAL
jgi:hypothetical protein